MIAECLGAALLLLPRDAFEIPPIHYAPDEFRVVQAPEILEGAELVVNGLDWGVAGDALCVRFSDGSRVLRLEYWFYDEPTAPGVLELRGGIFSDGFEDEPPF